MYNYIRNEIKRSIENFIGEKIQVDEIQESKIADFSFKTFKIAEKLGKKQDVLANEISLGVKSLKFIERVSSEGAYVNFFLNYPKTLKEFLKNIRKDKNYGKGKVKKRKIILEHTSINPSGPIHVGRLRNSLIGDALKRILNFYGYEVETHYYVNDIGKQIAIIAQGFADDIKYDNEISKKYKCYENKEDFQIFFEYVVANKKFQEDLKFQQKVQDLIKSAESGNREALEKIKEVAKKCLVGQKKTLDKLNIKFDSFDFESKFIENGSVEKILKKLKDNEFAVENELGFGLNLEKFGLKRRDAITVLARKDGTSVYLTRDLCYHLEKARLGDEMLNILGEDHKFEFLELKCILENFLKLRKPLRVVHFSFVNFEGEELSTRKGLILAVDKLIDEAIEKAKNEIKKRGIASEEIAPIIGIGAIKYHILKTSPQKQITFRWEDALNFDGETGPYIQYAHARCCSLLKKFSADIGKIKIDSICTELSDEEKSLLKKLIKFPYIVENSVNELKPNILASYLYELSSEFSRFYKKCQVLGVEKGISERRILLVDATRIVIKKGLELLGIDAPERM
ncbi:MAG: arginine--tRNA ligase [Candidatus Altiarchaeota archaeon]